MGCSLHALPGVRNASAQTQYTWSTTTTNTAWLTTTNWNVGGSFPGLSGNFALTTNGAPTDIAIIGNRAFTGSIGIDFSAAAANGSLTLGAIQLNAAAAGDLTIQSSSGAGVLVLRGEEVNAIPDVMLANTSAGAANLIISNTNTLEVRLGQNNNVFLMSAGRSISIQGILGDNGSGFGFTAQGGGTLILNNANTYGGRPPSVETPSFRPTTDSVSATRWEPLWLTADRRSNSLRGHEY